MARLRQVGHDVEIKDNKPAQQMEVHRVVGATVIATYEFLERATRGPVMVDLNYDGHKYLPLLVRVYKETYHA